MKNPAKILKKQVFISKTPKIPVVNQDLKAYDLKAYIGNREISNKQKREVRKAVNKVVKNYSETLKMLQFK